MVRQAFDKFGNVSEPFIIDGTIKAKIYLMGSTKKWLIPSINKHHREEENLFWPDLAPS